MITWEPFDRPDRHIPGRPPDWAPASHVWHPLTEQAGDIPAVLPTAQLDAARVASISNDLRRAQVRGFTLGVLFATAVPLAGYGLVLALGALLVHFGGMP